MGPSGRGCDVATEKIGFGFFSPFFLVSFFLFGFFVVLDFHIDF